MQSCACVLATLTLAALPASASARTYLVFVDGSSAPGAVAREAGAQTDFEFTRVANGFAANLSDSQAAELAADPRVTEIREDQPFALAQFGTADFETGAFGGEAFRRGDFSSEAFRRGDFSSEAFRRGDYDAEAFRRGAFRRGDYDAEAFRRGAFRRGAFRRGSVGTPYVSQWTPTGVQRIGAAGWADNVNADIAILDSGIDRTHRDLNVRYAGSCVPGEDGRDLSGHGTMVAGLAAARDNRFGVVGAAPGARIWSVKVSDEAGTIMESAALCGLEFVLNNASSIEVANLSWSGYSESLGSSCSDLQVPSGSTTNVRGRRSHGGGIRGRSRHRGVVAPSPQPASGSTGNDVDPDTIDALHAVLCGVVDAGVTVVAAAGNDAADADSYLPAAWPETIAVSSFSDTDGRPGGMGRPGCLTGDADDTFSSFSNFGSSITIAAPGECLLSTDIDGGYAYGSGTSFATPLVAGVAAVYASRDRRSTPSSIREKLLATAEAGPIAGDPDNSQEGMLRASRR